MYFIDGKLGCTQGREGYLKKLVFDTYAGPAVIKTLDGA